jgi:hypothetical protein
MQQLENAFRKAHAAGDTAAATQLANEIRSMRSQPQQSGNPLVEAAKGLKGGFDRAAYGLAQLTDGIPDLPISKETRDAYNSNPVVQFLGVTAPSREERQAAIDKSRQVADSSTAGMIGDAIGNAIPNIAAGVATGGMSVMPAAATQALTSYMTTPGGIGDRSASGALAAAGEGVGRALPLAVSRLAQPINPTAAAQRLINEGVYPTPGAAAGGVFKRIEDGLTSVPLVGDGIMRGQRLAAEQGAGAAMSRGGFQVAPGRAGYQQLSQHFDNAFNNATSNLAFDLNDPAFQAGVQNVMRNRGLNAAGVDDINQFFGNLRTNTNMPAPGAPGSAVTLPGQAPTRQLMGGEDFHGMLQNLRTEGASFRKAQDPFQRRLGEAYRDIYNLADNSLSTQGLVQPGAIDAFREVRRQYAQVAPALKAGELNTVVRNKGVFTPEQYQSSLANNAKRMGDTARLREGTLPQQQLADDMVDVLGSRYQDSGTAYRAALNLGVLAPTSVASIPAAVGLTGGGALSYLVNSNPMRQYMVGGYGIQPRLVDALRNFSPMTGQIGAATAPQLDW